MNVTLCKFADYALTDQQGKNSLIGIFSSCAASNFPATFGPLSICIEIEFDASDHDRQHTVSVRLVDEDGRDIFAFDMEFPSQPAVDPVAKTRVFAHTRTQQLVFPKPGVYRLDLHHDGQVIGQETLMVQEMRMQPHTIG